MTPVQGRITKVLFRLRYGLRIIKYFEWEVECSALKYLLYIAQIVPGAIYETDF